MIGWIGQSLLVQPSKMAHRIFFSLFYIQISSFKYKTIVSSSALVFVHSDLDPDPDANSA